MLIYFRSFSGLYNKHKGLEYVGGNTGNIVFDSVLREQLQVDYETELDDRCLIEKLRYIEEPVYGIMPSSNFIHHPCWLKKYNNSLKKMDMKFTLVGVGAQAKLTETPRDVVDRMDADEIEFFRLVGEKAYSIGVRGEFSAECLDLLGIKNVEIIGCPSFYRNQEDSIFKMKSGQIPFKESTFLFTKTKTGGGRR